jgi:PAS domain S-box-containing protein
MSADAGHRDDAAEIARLIDVLHETDQRLEELLAGEVDSVTDRKGQTILLRRAQEHLRSSESARQASILAALPATIALLDPQGLIISVNKAWREFGTANGLALAAHAVGTSYLDVCDMASGAPEGEATASGIRSVLSGASASFSIEYACHSPVEQRWFRLRVVPLADNAAKGAVVMHTDITERRQTADEVAAMALRTELRERVLSTALASITDFVQIYDRQARLLFANQPLLDHWNLTLEQVVGKDLLELSYPASPAGKLKHQITEVFETGRHVSDELPYTRPGGGQGWHEYIFSPATAADGTVDFVIGSTRDITGRKLAAAHHDNGR